ncbi:hypothetical protein QQG74_09550 [Micromonospora sp. FIMYZ51]|uniref:hypothetical protein n=1 Tax=Micromonospora sp. FIMYZ51 TaxID=3051832 RepID=UPI00311EFF45
MDATFGVVLAAALSAVAAVLASVITSRVAGRANRTNAMLTWAEQMRESEAEARREARESRERAERIRDEADADVDRLRGKVRELESGLANATALVERLSDTLTQVASEVWRPEPDIPALRRLVGRPSSGVNGRP